jgi:hypothetical protein
MHVAAWKDLMRADLPMAGAARVAFPTRQHGGYDHGASEPRRGGSAGFDDAAADFVAEREGERMPRGDPVVEEAEIGVTDAAAGDLDDHVVVAGAFVTRLAAHWGAGVLDDP